MDVELKGIKVDWERFEQLKKDRWVAYGETTFKCSAHDTLFNSSDEPCWQCYSECEIEL